MTQECAVSFECYGDRLVGIMHSGKKDAETGVLIAVGGPQYRVGSHRQFVLMARHFSAAGIPVLRFDYRGMGDAEGTPRDFDTVEKDIRATIDYFTTALPLVKKIVLLGLCDAASASLMYAHTDERVSGLILLNPWVRTLEGEARAYVRHYYLQRLRQKSFWRKAFSREIKIRRSLREFLQARRTAYGRPTDRRACSGGNRDSFIDRMLAGLLGFHGPVLFLISGRDLTAREFADLCVENGAWRHALSRPGTEVQRFPEADHTMSRSGDLRAVSHYCVNWAAKL